MAKEIRLNLELGPKSTKALDCLQVALEASSRAEVIRRALQTMLKIVEETQQGSKWVIERTNGERVLMFPLVEPEGIDAP